MKINLIGMILNNCGRAVFNGALLDDDRKPMPAADSLHHMIMEYAKVVNGGASKIVTVSNEIRISTFDLEKFKNMEPIRDDKGRVRYYAGDHERIPDAFWASLEGEEKGVWMTEEMVRYLQWSMLLSDIKMKEE